MWLQFAQVPYGCLIGEFEYIYTWDILKCDQRDVESIAEPDEARALDRSVDI